MTESQAAPPFVRQLRWTLRHLYDPAELGKSPLLELLGVSSQAGPSGLRRVLLESIEALKPRPSTPPEAKGWRIYRALFHRYTEQFTPYQVAKALGLSVRQLRRQESLALRVLADYLWSRYEVGARTMPSQGSARPQVGADGSPVEAPSRERELQWLEASLPSEVVAPAEVLEGALRVIEPLRVAMRVQVDCRLPADLPQLAVPGATLRQALLDTLTAAVRSVPGGRVLIAAQACPPHVGIDVQPQGPCLDPAPPAVEYAESLEMARRLVALCRGSLSVMASQEDDGPFVAHLQLPSAQAAAVLVVDDNADTLQLFQRYLLGTRYPFLGTRDPQQALALSRQIRPWAIVLDVMLPGVDGWELLGRFRGNPGTAGTPVIICTILPEEQLALSLGAAAFLRKPVSRADFLAALEAQAGPPEPGSL